MLRVEGRGLRVVGRLRRIIFQRLCASPPSSRKIKGPLKWYHKGPLKWYHDNKRAGGSPSSRPFRTSRSRLPSAFGVRLSELVFRVPRFVFQGPGFVFQVPEFVFRVSGSGFRVSGSGFRVSCFGTKHEKGLVFGVSSRVSSSGVRGFQCYLS